MYVHGDNDVREFWQPSPDTEEIRQHLLDIVREPEEHTDGYPFYSPPPHAKAIEQLVDFGDQRVVEALEDLVQRDEVKEARPDIPRADQDRASKTGPVTELRWNSLGTCGAPSWAGARLRRVPGSLHGPLSSLSHSTKLTSRLDQFSGGRSNHGAILSRIDLPPTVRSTRYCIPAVW